MPTDLPRPKRKRSPRNLAVAIPTHPVLSGLLNAFMIATVLVLFALVLLHRSPTLFCNGRKRRSSAATATAHCRIEQRAGLRRWLGFLF